MLRNRENIDVCLFARYGLEFEMERSEVRAVIRGSYDAVTWASERCE